MEQASRCTVCGELEEFRKSIRAEDLSLSSGAGCDACKLLFEGISVATDASHDVLLIDLVVDVSLYAMLKDKNNGLVGVVEFYTHLGRWSSLVAVGR